MSDETIQDQQSSSDESTAESKDTGRAGGDEKVLADLAKERDKRQAAERKLAELQQAAKSEQEKALDKAREEARAEVEAQYKAKLNEQTLRAEITRLARDKFVDPADPLGALNLSEFEVDDHGKVNEKAINSELDRLLKAKPHWAKQATKGSADQGARGTGTASNDMNARIRRAAGRE